MDEAAEVARTRFKLANNLSKTHLLLMQKIDSETDDLLLQRTWRTIVKKNPQVIIPLITEKFVRHLLQMVSS